MELRLIKPRIKNIVKHLLTEKKELRDNDVLLYIEVIKTVIYNPDAYKGTKLIEVAYNRGIHFETVRRTRQLLQEKYEDLRGEKYSERHKRKEEIKNEIVNIKKNNNI